MKKLLCLLMAVALVFAFAACGGNDTESASQPAGNNTATGATSIKFDAETYTVGVEEYIEFKNHVTVEPAGAEIKFSCSDETIAVVYSATRASSLAQSRARLPLPLLLQTVRLLQPQSSLLQVQVPLLLVITTSAVSPTSVGAQLRDLTMLTHT